MQAARLHEYGKPLVIDDVPRPTPGAGQVVIRVEGAGFCHSDLHIISGDIQILPRMPLTLGHENAGTVFAHWRRRSRREGRRPCCGLRWLGRRILRLLRRGGGEPLPDDAVGRTVAP